MNGQSTFRFCLIFLVTAAAVHAEEVKYDFSNGMGATGMDYRECGNTPGKWTVADAKEYIDDNNPLAPEDGKVIVGEAGKVTCMKISEPQLIDENFKMKVRLYVPRDSTVPKLKVNLITGGTDLPPDEFTDAPVTRGWHEIDLLLPKLTKPGIYTVEVWALRIVQVSIREIIVTKTDVEPDTTLAPVSESTTVGDPIIETTTLQPVDETTTLEPEEETTTLEPEEETTTLEPADETTIEVTDESSTVTSIVTTKRTTAAPLQTTAQPPQQVFPDVWSLILGIVIGILLTSLVVFIGTCFWWVWGAAGKTITIANNPASMLPRLEVVSNSSQKSITGSMDSQTMSVDPFWIKSKGWAHVP